MKAAPKEDIEDASSSCEAWVVGFGVLVVVAVLAEFGIAVDHPPYHSRLDHWGTAFADLFIGLGVAGEIALSMWNNTLQGELRDKSNKRVEDAETALKEAIKIAGEAHERAADIERVAAWRHIDEEQRSVIFLALAGKLPKEVIIGSANDPEAIMFAKEIEDILWALGVHKITRESRPIQIDNDPLFGLFVASTPPVYQNLFQSAFENAIISVVPFPPSMHPLIFPRSTSFSGAFVPQPDRLFLYVGHKFRPELVSRLGPRPER